MTASQTAGGRSPGKGLPASAPPLYIAGYCSSCLKPARMSGSGSWWHEGEACPARSYLIRHPMSWEPSASFIEGVRP